MTSIGGQLDLSAAWAGAFLHIYEAARQEVVPFVTTITQIPPNNADPAADAIRLLVDQHLSRLGGKSVETVAGTIFPNSLWNRALPPDRSAKQLFSRFEQIRGRVLRAPGNANGHYFDRLVHYQPKGSDVYVNQLAHICETRRLGNMRRSALQASVFDPTVDHTHQRQRGFPCMQQVVFTPHGEADLSISAFYATQHLVTRGYGNYLGLLRLGQFIASQLERQLVSVTCVAAVAGLGTNLTRERARPLATELRRLLESQATP